MKQNPRKHWYIYRAATALFVFYAVLGVQPLQSQTGEKNNTDAPVWTLSTSVYTALVYGQLGEYVFSEAQSYRDDGMLSELIWDLKPALMQGFRLELEFNDVKNSRLQSGAEFGIDFSGAVPLPSGSMVDRDWINTTSFRTDPDDPLSPSHYSKHDVVLLGGYRADVWALMKIGSSLQFLPGVGFRSHYYTFDGRDGSGIYAWGESEFHGTVISYRQYYRIPYLSFGLLFPVSARGEMRLRGDAGWPVQVDAIDHHYTTRMEFYDFPRGGMYAGMHLDGRLGINERMEISISGAVEYVPLFKGSSYQLLTQSGAIRGPFSNGGGASMLLGRLSLGLRISSGW